jgi:GNAT superfamily N-acetyltransferase
MPIEVRPAASKHERRVFLTFPWTIYRGDALWVPPLIPEKEKVIDPARGLFFRDGAAELFIAWKDAQPAGTICLAEEKNNTRHKGFAECMYGFVECIDDYTVFEAMFHHAENWARARGMRSFYGPYNLDREDSRGILIEGRDRPPAVYCGHHPPYYQEFFERYGFEKGGEDGLAYAIDIDLNQPKVQRLMRLADQVRAKNPHFKIRSANLRDKDAEIGRIVHLQNRGLEHMPGFVPFTRTDIESIILPLLDMVDLELVLFAEVDGEPAGFFPGVPNFNEIIIHLNGLRYPWDTLRALVYQNRKPRCLAIKSVVMEPKYRDTGLALLMFDEMVRCAAARGYQWADLSLTGEDNKDTWALAHHMGAKIYKRYRFYRKDL